MSNIVTVLAQTIGWKNKFKVEKVWDSALTVENVWESVIKVEKVCQNLRKYEKFWKLRKCAESRESVLKVEKLS